MGANSSWSSTELAGLDLGVVIVSFNTSPLLDRCLTTLHAALAEEGLRASSEVWVVDNASSDGSAAMVATRHPWVRLVALERNVGFTAGNNVVLRRYASDAGQPPGQVLLLNPDTEIQPGALGPLRAALAGRSEVAVAGPLLRYPDGRFQHSAFRFPGVAQTWLDLLPVARLMDSRLNGRYPLSRYATGSPFAVDFVLGACMLVRMAALRAVGPLDEGFYMYCEEVDWCRRFRAAGWETMCVPEAIVVHHGGGSTRHFQDAMFEQLWRSRRRYFDLHAGPATRGAARATMAVGLAIRTLADRRAAARGSISAAERDRRAAAYRRVLTGGTG